jgi:hypothetical protein
VAALFVTASPAQQQDGLVQRHVEWYTSHKPVEKGEIRIEGHGSKLHDGEFSFDFAAYHLTGGEAIHISVKDGTEQNLRVIDPLDGNTSAPKPPASNLVWRVARENERIQLSAEFIDKNLAWVILSRPPQETAKSCDPSSALLASAALTFKVPISVVEESLETWSNQASADGLHLVHWNPNADPQTRCRAWRFDQAAVLRAKLRTDSHLLAAVKDVTPPDKLKALYWETANTRVTLGAISAEDKEWTTAHDYFQQALTELDRAGPDPGETEKKQLDTQRMQLLMLDRAVQNLKLQGPLEK